MIWWEMGVDHIFGFMGVDLMGVNQIYYPSHITAVRKIWGKEAKLNNYGYEVM